MKKLGKKTIYENRAVTVYSGDDDQAIERPEQYHSSLAGQKLRFISLDESGELSMILATKGENLNDYAQKVPEISDQIRKSVITLINFCKSDEGVPEVYFLAA